MRADMLHYAPYLGVLAVLVAWGTIGFHQLLARRERQPGAGALVLLAVVGVGPAVVALATPRAFAAEFTVGSASAPVTHIPAGQALTLTTLALCVALVVIEGRRSSQRTGRPLILAALAFYACPILSSLLSGNGGFSRQLFLAPAVLVALYMSPRPSVEQAVRALRWVLRVYTWGSLVALVVAPTWATYRIHIGGSTYYQRQYFGFTQLVGLAATPDSLAALAAAAAVLEVARVGRRRGWQFHAGAAFAVVVLAESRTGFIAVVIGLMFLAARLRRPDTRDATSTRFAAVAAIGFMALLVPSVQQTVASLLAPDTNVGSLSGRTTVWQIAFNEFKASPAVGYGPTIFGPVYRDNKLGADQAWVGQAHNQVLQSLGAEGLFGIVAWALLAGALLLAARHSRVATLGASTGLLAVLFVRSITDSAMDNRALDPTFLLVVVVFMLLLAGLPNRSRTADAPAELDSAGVA